MQVLDKIKRLYFKLYSIDSRVNSSIVESRYKILNLLCSDGIGVEAQSSQSLPVIVSLTTYGLKIQQVFLTIESLLHQTYKPNRIILWLDEQTYFNRDEIPLSLKLQEKRGLEIKFCKDVRSYTKLVPTIKNYPHSIIISVDDDIIYPIDFIEKLMDAYKREPHKIYFYRGHQITIKKDGKIGSYLDWVKKGAHGSSIYNVPTGVYGILYPPHILHEDILNEDLFLKLCPYADDIWFKAMSLLKNVECEKIPYVGFEHNFVPLAVDYASSLQKINVVEGGNDVQIKRVFDYYDLYQYLK